MSGAPTVEAHALVEVAVGRHVPAPTLEAPDVGLATTAGFSIRRLRLGLVTLERPGPTVHSRRTYVGLRRGSRVGVGVTSQPLFQLFQARGIQHPRHLASHLITQAADRRPHHGCIAHHATRLPTVGLEREHPHQLVLRSLTRMLLDARELALPDNMAPAPCSPALL